MSGALAIDLQQAIVECQDGSVRAVVVTGQPHFSVGADIKEFKQALDAGRPDENAPALLEAVRLLEALDKPTIAAVHGSALGGGCELSLGCDFRYLSEDARIGQPEVLLGIIPGAGGTQRLQRVVGFQKAKEIIYSGRHLGAEEALEIGLADKVFAVDQVLDRAMADAADWASQATLAIAAAKRAMIHGRGMATDEGLDWEQTQFQGSFLTEDATEGVNAFVEKRSAEFRGR